MSLGTSTQQVILADLAVPVLELKKRSNVQHLQKNRNLGWAMPASSLIFFPPCQLLAGVRATIISVMCCLDTYLFYSCSSYHNVILPTAVSKSAIWTEKLCPLRWGHISHLPGSPPQHQLWVLGHVLLHKVIQECFEDVSEVFQLPMQRHSKQ